MAICAVALHEAALSVRPLAFLDDTNLSEAQKIELLQTLWSIMSAFVDLAFGTDPVQQALPSITAGQHTDDSIVSSVEPAERE